MKNVKGSNPLSANITKWSHSNNLSANCGQIFLSVFDHFVGFVLKGLTKFCKLIWLSFVNYTLSLSFIV